MKISMKSMVPLILLCTIQFVTTGSSENIKNSKPHGNSFGSQQKPRFISFDEEGGEISVDWSITVPFIAIPIDNEPGKNGEVSPLLNVNTKALGIAGLITSIAAFVGPLVSSTSPGPNYRSIEGTQWSQLGNTINEVIFGNNYIGPCVQRVICTIVSMASNAEKPTSSTKIIDGLSSHKWFKNALNGTIIEEAVATGRDDNKDCSRVYKSCLMSTRLLKNILSQFGAI